MSKLVRSEMGAQTQGPWKPTVSSRVGPQTWPWAQYNYILAPARLPGLARRRWDRPILEAQRASGTRKCQAGQWAWEWQSSFWPFVLALVPSRQAQVPSCPFPPVSKPAHMENSPVQETFSWCVMQAWSSKFLHTRHAQFPESTGGKILKISHDFANILKIKF